MIIKTFQSPFCVFAIIALICASALGLAFIAEAFLNLEPCRLCIYQRYPFAFGMIAGLLGMKALRQRKCASVFLLVLCAVAFLANSAIAFYHTGVEQDWWNSAMEECTITAFEDTSGQSILENIMSAPTGSCSEIPWQDPLFGLSMANWNIPFCFFLSIFCLFSAYFIKKREDLS